MSYILEALKKSQQERELGQVPTLDTTGLFTEDKEPPPSNHWGLLAVGLAALAVVIALYAALRPPAPPVIVQAPPVTLPLIETPVRLIPSAEQPVLTPTPALTVAAPPAPLIEAPPPKRVPPPVTPPVTPMPVKLPPVRASVPRIPASQMDDDLPYPDPNYDPQRDGLADAELEYALQQQLNAEQGHASAPEPFIDPRPDHAPIPTDLINDIEAFKRQVRREQGLPPLPSKP